MWCLTVLAKGCGCEQCVPGRRLAPESINMRVFFSKPFLCMSASTGVCQTVDSGQLHRQQASPESIRSERNASDQVQCSSGLFGGHVPLFFFIMAHESLRAVVVESQIQVRQCRANSAKLHPALSKRSRKF